MKKERYTVGSVTGAQIVQGGVGGGGGKWNKPLPTLWYVHDSAYCYRVVASTGWDEQKAREIAKGLNAAERAYLERVERRA